MNQYKSSLYVNLGFSLLFVSLIILCKYYIDYFNISSTGLTKNGLSLIIYNISKIFITFSIIALTLLIGSYTLKKFNNLPKLNISEISFAGGNSLSLVIIFGYTIISVAMSLLALLNLLYFGIVLIIISTTVILSRLNFIKFIHNFNNRDNERELFLKIILILLLLFLSINSILYFPVYDPNIWEHYIHYYREVLNNHGVSPNIVWHHFYVSKFAGFTFLSIILTDELGVVIGSTIISLFTGQLVFMALKKSTNTYFAIIGSVLLLLYIFTFAFYSGFLFKHHPYILFICTVIIWNIYNNYSDESLNSNKNIKFTFLALYVYFGLYQPTLLIILLPTLIIFYLLNYKNKEFDKTIVFNIILFFGLGFVLSLFLNYFKTGIFELTPVNLMWMLADKNKFEEVFGLESIQFFINVNNDVSEHTYYSPFYGLSAFPFGKYFVFTIIIIEMYSIIIFKKRLHFSKDQYILLSLSFSFLISTYLCVQLYQTPAAQRLAYLNLSSYTIILCLYLNSFLTILPNILNKFKYVILLLIILIFLGANFKKIGLINPINSIKYIIGIDSPLNAIKKIEKIRPISFDVETMIKFNELKKDSKIIRLTYDTGFSYAFPFPGIYSEPTYSFFSSAINLKQDSAESIKDYLILNNYIYFTLDLRKDFFSNLVFSNLFEIENIKKYFSIVYRDDHKYILKLDESSLNKINDIDNSLLLSIIEIKKSQIFYDFLSYDFYPKNNININNNCLAYKNAVNSYFNEAISKLYYENTKVIIKKIIESAVSNTKCINNPHHGITDYNVYFGALIDNLKSASVDNNLNGINIYKNEKFPFNLNK